jgi:outer membrane protein OmpA-like peptidoglycan-associated protein
MLSKGLNTILIIASLASAVNAQDVQGYEPVNGVYNYVTVESSDIGDMGDRVFSLGSSYASKPLVEQSVNGSLPEYRLIEGLSSFSLQTSLNLAGLLQLRISLPYGFSYGRKVARGLMGQGLNVLDDGSGWNNLSTSIKLPLYRASSRQGFGLALLVPQSIPLKNESKEASQAFFMTGIKLAADYRIGRARLAANIGYRYRLKHLDGDPRVIRDCVGSSNGICGNPYYLGDALLYSLAGSYRLSDQLDIIAELYGKYFYNEATNPLEWLLSARLDAGDGLYMILGGGQGLGNAIGSPSLRLIFSLGYTMNALKDSDLDGIADDKDLCRNDKEDVDGYQDLDGCPDLDNDNDGVQDAQDKCPMQAEDMDGFEDADGCIDADNDRDGIIDSRDSCPMQAEDIDRFQDSDGCPDDNELSSRVLMMNGQLFAAGNFYFERHRSTLVVPQSNEILDNLAEALMKNPKIKRLQIESHMDDSLEPDEALALTRDRADAVKARLIERGISASVLATVGYGSSKPLINSEDANKKKFNNRIILRVVEMD